MRGAVLLVVVLLLRLLACVLLLLLLRLLRVLRPPLLLPPYSHYELTRLSLRYLQMRQLGGGGKTITATPRQLESLIRLSEALARMRFDETVYRSDVLEAVRLMRVATQAAATDPRTGTIDMDMITTGRSSVDREAMLNLRDQVKSAIEDAGSGKRLGLSEVKAKVEQMREAEGEVEEFSVAMKSVVEVVAQLAAETNSIVYFSGSQQVMMR